MQGPAQDRSQQVTIVIKKKKKKEKNTLLESKCVLRKVQPSGNNSTVQLITVTFLYI